MATVDKKFIRLFAVLLIAALAILAGKYFGTDREAAESINEADLAALGRSLFFNTNLSLARTQSCASCHDPARAFAGSRDNGVNGEVSLGDDGASLGERNAPSLTYVEYTPVFYLSGDGEYIGGQFRDGREPDLESQAGAPFLNPIEMAMPDKAAVVARLRENPDYAGKFPRLFGKNIFADAGSAYSAMTSAIAAYERTDEFSPFDSKYDRYLRGEYEPTEDEAVGIYQFFLGVISCNSCHMLRSRPKASRETFSGYQYRNIGVPGNLRLNETNGRGENFVDHGLLAHPSVTESGQDGKFKIPSLRNVAVTAPYMHNGVFHDLRTVVEFYNKYNDRSDAAQINPETGEPWRDPEVPDNIALDELEIGQSFDEQEVDAFVAFLKMLTDSRYESLLED